MEDGASNESDVKVVVDATNEDESESEKNPEMDQTVCLFEAGHGLTTAFNTKWRRYGEKCEREGIWFCPFILDTFGAFHERAVIETKKLGQALARATGQSDSETIKHLFQCLSVLLIKGNATLIIVRVPTIVESCVNGIL